MSDTTIDVLQNWLDRLQQGDSQARDQLIDVACKRLTILTRRMLNDFGRLRQWEQTDDVFQNAMLRLATALKTVKPATVREFHGLAAEEIRRELLDMSRKYFGRRRPSSTGQEGESPLLPGKSPAHAKGRAGPQPQDDTPGPALEPPDTTHDPGRIVAWTEFHNQIEALPAEERELVNLLYYEELPQEEVAQLLGVDKRTVKRRWREVRRQLHKLVKDWLPGA